MIKASAHEPRSGRTTDPHSRPESQSHDGSEPPLRGSPTSSLSHDVYRVPGTHRVLEEVGRHSIPSSAEGEAVRLGVGVEELDLESALRNWPALADQAVAK